MMTPIPSGYFELVKGVTKLCSIVTFDATRDATRFGVVGHQHHVAAGEADIGGQRCTLRTALFLVNLNDDFGTFFDGIFNAHLSVRG
jgi:hypothetical protein